MVRRHGKKVLSQSPANGAFYGGAFAYFQSFTGGESGYTLGNSRERAQRTHTLKKVSYPSLPSHHYTSQHPPYQNFAAFGAWSGVLPKNAESLRDSDALMRVAVPRRRAPLGCVIFSVSVEIYGFTPRTQGFLCVRGGGGITTPARAAYCRSSRRPLVKAAYLPFSEVAEQYSLCGPFFLLICRYPCRQFQLQTLSLPQPQRGFVLPAELRPTEQLRSRWDAWIHQVSVV